MPKLKLTPIAPMIVFGGSNPLPISINGYDGPRYWTSKQTGRTYLVSDAYSEVTNRKHDREGAASTAFRDPTTKLYWRRIGE